MNYIDQMLKLKTCKQLDTIHASAIKSNPPQISSRIVRSRVQGYEFFGRVKQCSYILLVNVKPTAAGQQLVGFIIIPWGFIFFKVVLFAPAYCSGIYSGGAQPRQAAKSVRHLTWRITQLVDELLAFMKICGREERW